MAKQRPGKGASLVPSHNLPQGAAPLEITFIFTSVAALLTALQVRGRDNYGAYTTAAPGGATNASASSRRTTTISESKVAGDVLAPRSPEDGVRETDLLGGVKRSRSNCITSCPLNDLWIPTLFARKDNESQAN